MPFRFAQAWRCFIIHFYVELESTNTVTRAMVTRWARSCGMRDRCKCRCSGPGGPADTETAVVEDRRNGTKLSLRHDPYTRSACAGASRCCDQSDECFGCGLH